MSLMVACPDAVLASHRELIGALSAKVFRAGERCGDGARTKLVNNLLAGINLVGAAEAMAMARRLGLALDTTLDVTLLQKDTRLAVAAAAAAGLEGPLGAAARDVFARAAREGLAGEDDAALFKLLSKPWGRQ